MKNAETLEEFLKFLEDGGIDTSKLNIICSEESKLEKAIKCLEEVNESLNMLASPLGVQQAYPSSFEADLAEACISNEIEHLEKLTRETLEVLL